jgi:hypothetical protein
LFRDYAQTDHENTKVRKHEKSETGRAVALGPGFLESIYQRAMEVALEHREIRFQRFTVLFVLSSFRSFVITSLFRD